MNLTAEIEKSQKILTDLWEQVQRLHEMGVDANDKVFDVFADRLEKEFARWEVLAEMDWECKFWLHDTKKIERN